MPQIPFLALNFPKSVRLTRRSEYLRVKTKGRSWSGRLMTLGVLHGTGDTKVGIITSKRVGSAVNRNRVRRRLREILRLARPQWASGFWLVIIARNRAADATFAELHAEWVKLAKRSGILNSTETPESP